MNIKNGTIQKGSELITRLGKERCLGEIYFNEYFGHITVGLQDMGNYSLQVLSDENGNLLENREGGEIAVLLDAEWVRMLELEEELSPVGFDDMVNLNKYFRLSDNEGNLDVNKGFKAVCLNCRSAIRLKGIESGKCITDEPIMTTGKIGDVAYIECTCGNYIYL